MSFSFSMVSVTECKSTKLLSTYQNSRFEKYKIISVFSFALKRSGVEVIKKYKVWSCFAIFLVCNLHYSSIILALSHINVLMWILKHSMSEQSTDLISAGICYWCSSTEKQNFKLFVGFDSFHRILMNRFVASDSNMNQTRFFWLSFLYIHYYPCFDKYYLLGI